MIKCNMCGQENCRDNEELCDGCRLQADSDNELQVKLIAVGHTEHCAARQVWGDGECECGKGPYKYKLTIQGYDDGPIYEAEVFSSVLMYGGIRMITWDAIDNSICVLCKSDMVKAMEGFIRLEAWDDIRYIRINSIKTVESYHGGKVYVGGDDGLRNPKSVLIYNNNEFMYFPETADELAETLKTWLNEQA